MLDLLVRRLRPDARLPTKSHDDDAGWDFYACQVRDPEQTPGGWLRTIDLGVAVAVPPGYVLVLKDRSSMAKKGFHVLGGVIDAGYRGEVAVILVSLGPVAQDLFFPIDPIRPGDRVCQGLVLPVPEVRIVEADQLPPSARGDTGFGSSGR